MQYESGMINIYIHTLYASKRFAISIIVAGSQQDTNMEQSQSGSQGINPLAISVNDRLKAFSLRNYKLHLDQKERNRGSPTVHCYAVGENKPTLHVR
jgi:hypothetical protein